MGHTVWLHQTDSAMPKCFMHFFVELDQVHNLSTAISHLSLVSDVIFEGQPNKTSSKDIIGLVCILRKYLEINFFLKIQYI